MHKLAWKAGVIGLGLTALAGSIALAADHRDADSLLDTNAAADINDVYAWVNGGKLNLIMTVNPFASANAAFSPNVQYVFHVSSQSAYGATTGVESTDVICELASATSAQCWVGTSEYVQGDPSAADGLTSADGKVKVFAGLRKDPFFFNLDGFKAVVRTVEQAAGSLMFDTNGCPQLDAGTSTLLVNQLSHDDGSATTVTDDFATANVSALVIQLDPALVNGGGPILGVYASTHEKP